MPTDIYKHKARANFPRGGNALLLVFLHLIIINQAIGQPLFVNRANEQNINHTYGIGLPSGGVSAVDFNEDGLDDITLTTSTGSPLYFYLNNGNTFSKQEFTLPGTEGEAKQILWVDYDNDGDKDLYITFLDIENRLFRNDGDFIFTDVTESSGLLRDVLPTYGAAWSDYDRDGYLDLYITDRRTGIYNQEMSNHLYRNQGDGTFDETTTIANVGDSSKAPFCAYFLDYNNDGWDDIYVAQDKKRVNSLFKNNGNGTFEDVSVETFTDLAMDAMSVTVGDYDNNGFLDIYVTNIPDGNKLLRNDGYGYFTEVANNTGTGFFNVGWGAQFLDIDNNKNLDLYVNGSRFGTPNPSSALYINNGTGKFESTSLIGDTATSYSNAVGDFNNDGFPDIIVNNPSPYQTFLWSNLNVSNNWLKLDLEGDLSNRDAIGTRVETYIDGQKYIQHKQCGTGFLGQNSDILHFGIGQANTLDSLIIKWPSGHQETHYDLTKNTTHQFVEGSGQNYLPKLNYVGEVVLCKGDSITINTGLFSKKLDYIWSDGSNKPSLTVGETGKYAVAVSSIESNINYESDTLLITVMDEFTPVIDYSIENVTCYGMMNGSVQLNIDGPGNYSISWDSGATGNSLENLGPGYYTYNVNSSAGCSVAGSVSIAEPDSIGIIINQVDFAEGTRVSAIVSGGNSPYNYAWSHSIEAKEEIIITENGDYEVVITDITGCSKTRQFRIENDLITSIAQSQDQIDLSIFPNPSSGEIYIQLKHDYNEVEAIYISTIFGDIINLQPADYQVDKIRISVSNVPPGLYILTVVLRNGHIINGKVQLH